MTTTTITYGYDPLYRLTSATYSSGEAYTYTYDQVGNRLAMGVNGQVITYTYDMANRLTQVGNVGYIWDDNGNLLADGVRTYTYDHANRLVQVVSGTLTTTFVYNGDGHRVAQATNGVTTTYVVAVLGLSQALIETTDGESIVYLYGHDLLAEERSSGWAWHLGDGLGSVRQLTDGAEEVTLAQGYAPFGEPLWSEGSGSTGFGFTGERWEAYTGLLFLRARYYEPGMGRFTQVDLWPGNRQQPLTMNPYLYALANPVNISDPSGLYPLSYDSPGDRFLSPSTRFALDWVVKRASAFRKYAILYGIPPELPAGLLAAEIDLDNSLPGKTADNLACYGPRSLISLWPN